MPFCVSCLFSSRINLSTICKITSAFKSEKEIMASRRLRNSRKCEKTALPTLIKSICQRQKVTILYGQLKNATNLAT
jgi:hypothetical protein